MGSLVQIASDSAKWVFMGTIRPVRRKRGAQTKSDRCTSEMKMQKLFTFVVTRDTLTQSLLQSTLHKGSMAISVTIPVTRQISSF